VGHNRDEKGYGGKPQCKSVTIFLDDNGAVLVSPLRPQPGFFPLRP